MANNNLNPEDVELLNSIESAPDLSDEDRALISSIKTDFGIEPSPQQDQPPQQPVGELTAFGAPVKQGPLGIDYVNPLTVVAKGGQAVAGGLEKVAEKAAELGPVGGVVGVPALMAAEALPKTETEAGIEIATLGAGKVLNSAIKAFKTPAAKKAIAAATRATAAIPERTTLEVLNDPKILKRAKSLEQATEDYVKKIPGLRNVHQSLNARLLAKGKRIASGADYNEIIAEVVNKSRAGTAKPQDILDGIQATNKLLGAKDFTKDADAIRQLLEDKQKFIDLLDQGYPQFKEANRALREAHIKAEFDTWLPKNKNMSPNVLRSLLAMRNVGAAVAQAGAGNLTGAAANLGAAAASSPKVVGKAIRAGAFLGQDVELGKALSGIMKKGKKASKVKVELSKSKKLATNEQLGIFEGTVE